MSPISSLILGQLVKKTKKQNKMSVLALNICKNMYTETKTAFTPSLLGETDPADFSAVPIAQTPLHSFTLVHACALFRNP